MKLLDKWANQSIILVLGTGGVGKTTVSAVLGGLLAASGRRVLVVTVDPSNRLKDALGLSGKSGVEEAVPIEAFGGTKSSGSLSAMILDTKTELDRLAVLMIPDEKARAAITDHVFYQKAAAKMAGTHEYMSMVRLLEALDSGLYDVIVLDTPPKEHALAFLDAPAKLDALLNADIFKAFVSASSGLSRLGMGAMRWRNVILKGIGRFAGEENFLAVLDFVLAFTPLFDDIRKQAAKFEQYLKGGQASTVFVTRPELQSVSPTKDAFKSLEQRGIKPDALIVNRVRTWPPHGCPSEGCHPIDGEQLKDTLANSGILELADVSNRDRLASAIMKIAEAYKAVSVEDARVIEELKEAAFPAATVTLPLLQDDVKDLQSLGGFAKVVRDRLGQFEPPMGPS